MLEDFGNWGYQLGAVGIVAFTVAFLVVVRWWSDILGRVVATAFTTMSGVLVMSTLRMIVKPDSMTFFVWRGLVFWLFGLGIWWGLGTFLWAQFIAKRRLTTPQTRREYNDAEADSADHRAGRDGDSRHDAGSPR